MVGEEMVGSFQADGRREGQTEEEEDEAWSDNLDALGGGVQHSCTPLRNSVLAASLLLAAWRTPARERPGSASADRGVESRARPSVGMEALGAAQGPNQNVRETFRARCTSPEGPAHLPHRAPRQQNTELARVRRALEERQKEVKEVRGRREAEKEKAKDKQKRLQEELKRVRVDGELAFKKARIAPSADAS